MSSLIPSARPVGGITIFNWLFCFARSVNVGRPIGSISTYLQIHILIDQNFFHVLRDSNWNSSRSWKGRHNVLRGIGIPVDRGCWCLYSVASIFFASPKGVGVPLTSRKPCNRFSFSSRILGRWKDPEMHTHSFLRAMPEWSVVILERNPNLA